ncbi:unnamed protein product [marine sediment metagenome]|uniref:Uncharacterized protein n=1 Tax=marine sediment metagenome TaxID=412755 RepID=X1J943_9ZZZZ
MINNHQDKDQLTLADTLILFMLKAPDMEKATGALLILIGKECMEVILNYKHTFKDYQAWRNHLVAALDNAQEKVDAQSR